MPEIISEYDFTKVKRRGKYDWDEILDGRIRRFSSEEVPASFAGSVKNNASKRGCNVTVVTEEDGSIVVMAHIVDSTK